MRRQAASLLSSGEPTGSPQRHCWAGAVGGGGGGGEHGGQVVAAAAAVTNHGRGVPLLLGSDVGDDKSL